MNNKSINSNPYGAYFKKHIEFKKCPFFLLWIHYEILKAYNIDIKVKRKGLPISGPRPMVRHKRLLALARILDGFTLKGFAEDLNLSYGVIRLWNREPRVVGKATNYQLLFAKDYIKEFEKRVFSKKLDLEKYSLKTTAKAHARVDSLVYEVKNYHPFIQAIILGRLMNKLETLPEDKVLPFGVTYLMLIDTLTDWTIFNPPKDKRDKEHFEQQIKRDDELLSRILKSLFSDFKRMITNGETKKALRFCDFFEDQMLKSFQDSTNLRIRYLNKGRSKGKIKRGETVRATKEKEAH